VLAVDARHAFLKLVAGVASSPPRLNKSFWIWRRRTSRSDRYSGPGNADRRVQFVTVPNAQTRGESLLTRPPPASPVVPSSPVRVTMLVSRAIVAFSISGIRRDQAHKLEGLVAGVLELVLFIRRDVEHIAGLDRHFLAVTQTVPAPPSRKSRAHKGDGARVYGPPGDTSKMRMAKFGAPSRAVTASLTWQSSRRPCPPSPKESL